MYTAEGKRIASILREHIIEALTNKGDGHNRGWYRAYVERHYDAMLDAVYAGNVLAHGFRSLELRDELRERGLL